MLICWYTSIPAYGPVTKVPTIASQTLPEVNIPLHHGGLAKGLHWQGQRADQAGVSLPQAPVKQHKLKIRFCNQTRVGKCVPLFTPREGRTFIL